MKPTVYRVALDVPGTLAITLRPKGGTHLQDDVSALAAEGVNVLVSLLTGGERFLWSLDEERAACATHGIEFLELPVRDLGVPADSHQFVDAARRLGSLLRRGQYIAVHCGQGIGRSGLLAVSIAISCGVGLEKACEAVSSARGMRVPQTSQQRDWLEQHVGEFSEPS